MYDPTIGQFLSEDPISYEGLDANLRRYVKNKPTMYTDPDGLKPVAKWLEIRVSATGMPASFSAAGVQKQLQAWFDRYKINVKVNVSVSKLFKNEELGWQHDVPLYCQGFGDGVGQLNWFNPVYWMVGIGHDLPGAFTWTPTGYRQNIHWNTKPSADSPIAFTGTGNANTTCFTNKINNQTAGLNWDILYANILIHEVLHNGALRRPDDLNAVGATPFDGGTLANASSQLTPLTDDEVNALNEWFDTGYDSTWLW